MYQGRRRKLNRLRGFDYSQYGWYFVTICVKNRECLFGDIVVGTGLNVVGTGFKPVPTFGRPDMVLNEIGKIVAECWHDLPNHYPNCRLDEFIVMPNHLHGIVVIDGHSAAVGTGLNVVGTGLKPVPTTTTAPLSEIIRGLKTFSARQINEIRQTPGVSIWQRSFHDHIIRNEKSYWAIKEYIRRNPAHWATDEENPSPSL